MSAPWVPPSNDDEESVQEPELSDDADELDAGVFGAIGLFSMLAERVDAHEALAAADGWGGGQYVTYRVDGRTCVRAQIVGESRADTERLVRTLDDWVQSLPSAFAKVSVVDELIVLESCDPGASADLATGDSYDALILPVARGEIEVGLIAEGATPSEARCAASAIVAEVTLEELLSDDATRFESDAWQDAVADITSDCVSRDL